MRGLAGEFGEVAHAAREGLQEGQGHRRPLPTQLEECDAREEQDARRRHGDRGRHVAAAIEERHLAERGAGAFSVKDLLAPDARRLPHLDGPLRDDEEPVTGVALREHALVSPERPRRAAPAEAPELHRR